MSKVIDITEKLSFDTNPKLIIKGKEYEVSADAPTMLKMLELMSKESTTNEDIVKAYDLIFPEKTRKELDKLKLSFNDLVIVISAAMNLVTGDDESGEQ